MSWVTMAVSASRQITMEMSGDHLWTQAYLPRWSIYIYPYELCCAVVMSWESMCFCFFCFFLENLINNNIVTCVAFYCLILPVKKQQVIKHFAFTGSLPSPWKWLWFFFPHALWTGGAFQDFTASRCVQAISVGPVQ